METNARFMITLLPSAATPLTTSVLGTIGKARILTTAVDGGGRQDAEFIPAKVTAVDEKSVNLAVPDTSDLAVGQLVGTSSGLVGRLTQVSPTVVAELVNSQEFEISARTSITNLTGQLRGTGSKVIFDVSAGSGVLLTNRVEVVDPSQMSASAGAISVGRIVATGDTSVGGTNSFVIGFTPPTLGASVYISVPGHS
jgi:hypothetical protein